MDTLHVLHFVIVAVIATLLFVLGRIWRGRGD
jgi:hypothetical protein